ncbi:MAG: phosphatidate cytidylyltransferase [Anaerolineales bacterium]|jgi:phytol kinase|nr:phosphatidate cytidylyltransferase [Anaerolineales bacterium]
MFGNDLLALTLTFATSLVWLRLNDFFAHRGWVDSALSRKIIHIGTGPLFVLCWLLFHNLPASRFLAALVPLAITMQFVFVGLGIIQDQAAVAAMSRTGDRREILRGPLYYGIVFVVLTILYWRNSPIGIVALMLVCGGDGLADILGRRFGVRKLPWSSQKSWMGSLGFFIGGFILTTIVLEVFVLARVFPAPITDYLIPIGAITLIVAFVEAISPPDIDNLTIALTAALLGHFWW